MDNVFISYIEAVKSFSFIKRLIAKFRYERFKSKLIKTSPSYDMLEEIANFIKEAEICYFYDNSANRHGLYSSRSYSPGENGFKIKKTDFTIICKLIQKDNQKITHIEINRHKGHKTTTSFKFIDSNWSDPLDNTRENHIILNNVISTIWQYTFGLCDSYLYNNNDSSYR